MRPRSVSSSSSKLAAVSLLLLLVICFFFHCATAARPLPTATPAHQENDGAKAAADETIVLHQEGAGGNGDEDSESEVRMKRRQLRASMEAAELVVTSLDVSILFWFNSQLMGAEAEEEACSEGNDECMQRRLLRDAHLDYIYTQHKGKP
ncbi:hypothetical protein ABZP36_034636 [Zizania latifolia]